MSARSAAHQLSATTATHVIARREMADARRALDGFAARSSVSLPPGGAIRTDAKSMPGSRTSPAKRKLPSLLAGPSSRGSGCPTSRALPDGREAAGCAAGYAIGRFFGELAEREGPCRR